jgi:hypothetical protein
MRKRNILVFTPVIVILIAVYVKYRELPFEDYQNNTLVEMQKFNSTMKRITDSYVNRHSIDEAYEKTFYDCVGSAIYVNDAQTLFLQSLEECHIDYTQEKNITYYNQSWIMRDFNKFNNSYMPLEKRIKKTIKDNKSYNMIKTSYTMNFNAQRPHMFVSIDFRAANLGGYMLERTMEGKVDLITKELYEVK